MGLYSGNIVKSDIRDRKADTLARKLNGISSVYFDSDPQKREFDAISDKYIIQTKHTTKKLKPEFLRQMIATFNAARDTGRGVYYHFEVTPFNVVINILRTTSELYGIELVIDVSKL